VYASLEKEERENNRGKSHPGGSDTYLKGIREGGVCD